jgi:hypothetical protein
MTSSHEPHHGLQGNFQLEHKSLYLRESCENLLHLYLIFANATIRAGHNHNRILTLREEKDHGYATGFVFVNSEKGGIHSIRLQRLEQLLAEYIGANAASQTDPCFQACHGNCLIGPFPSWHESE